MTRTFVESGRRESNSRSQLGKSLRSDWSARTWTFPLVTSCARTGPDPFGRRRMLNEMLNGLATRDQLSSPDFEGLLALYHLAQTAR